jgi:hypothetical protein
MRPSVSGLSCLPTVMSHRPGGPPSRAPDPPKGPDRGAGRSRHLRLIGVLVIGLAAAGAKLLAHTPAHPQVVSGRAGPKMTKSGAPERWEQGEVTITLDASLDQLSPAARESVQQAFGSWLSSQAKLPRVTFDSRPHAPLLLEPDGENRIYYAPITLPGHENDLAITLGYSNPDTGEILEADIVVNSRHPFALLDAVAMGAGQGAAQKDDTRGPGPGAQGNGSGQQGGNGAPGSAGTGSDGTHGGSKGASPGAQGDGNGNGNGKTAAAPTGPTPGAPGNGSGKAAAAPTAPTPGAPGNGNGKTAPTPTPPAAAACSNKYDLESVVAHEAGHFWGLGEDMTDPTATMYFSTSPCTVGKRVLKADDSHEVSALYAEPATGSGNEPAAAGVKHCSVRTLGQSAPSSAGSVAAALAGLAVLRRRRRA